MLSDVNHSILVIDDEIEVLRSFTMFLEDAGYRPLEARSGKEGIELFRRHRPDLVFTDLMMPGIDGLDVIREVKGIDPDVPVVVISGAGNIGDAVNAIKLGACDYITKPVRNLSELELVARRALDTVKMKHELTLLRKSILTGRVANPKAFSEITTRDPGMQRVFQYVEAVAPTGQPVLITGQTGTGKEAIARSLHDLSRKPGKFVAVNVGGLDDQVFSDTLFGHLRGAFTGADRVREGMIVQSSDGTLFLDEIGELTEASQVKLLRLLQEHEFFPLGADRPSRTTARILAATNRDLEQMVREKRFREDLYYRLTTHTVSLPPLSHRVGDIPLLLDIFISEASRTMGKTPPRYHPSLVEYLATYQFPGNIRELKAMVFDAVARCNGTTLQNDLFLQGIGMRQVATPLSLNGDAVIAAVTVTPGRLPTLKEAQEVLVAKALELAGGNQGAAARYLGITRQGLNKMLNRNRER